MNKEKYTEIFAAVAKLRYEAAMANMFVTNLPGTTVQAVTETEPQQEKNMTDFTTERRALNSDAYNSFVVHERKLREKFHIDPIEPKSMAEVIKLIKDNKFEGHDDEKRLNKEYRYDNPLHEFRFREVPADEVGHDKARTKLNEQLAHVKTRISVLDPTEALKDVEAFRTYH